MSTCLLGRVSFLSLSAIALSVAVVALILINFSGGARTGHAAFGVSDPTPGSVDTLAVDTNTTGNTPTSVGTVQGCRAITGIGTTFDVDVVIDEIAAANGSMGTSLDLVYNPTVLQVTARGPGSTVLFYQAPPLGFYFDTFSDPVPDTDGDYRHEGAELGGTNTESGEGVMVRLTMKIVGSGVSVLDLTDNVWGNGTPQVYDAAAAPLPVSNVIDGYVRTDGTPCVSAAANQFCIFGPSTGVGWTWSVTGSSGSFNGSVLNGTVPSGGTESQLAFEWVKDLNIEFAGALTANQLPGILTNCFEITPGGQTLIVDGCTVTPAGCSFNPTVYLMAPIGGVADLIVDRSEDSTGPSTALLYSAIAAAAAVLAAGVWFGRKRWMR